eukprot:9046784-Alexandrium_andersonii.AAC.1
MESQVPWCVCRTAEIRAGGTRSSSNAVGSSKASLAKALSFGGRELSKTARLRSSRVRESAGNAKARFTL